MRRCFRTGGPRQALLLVLALSGFGIPGCRPGIEEGVPAGTHAIEMAVLKGREGETLALVPVYIEGKGPFAFALDTGASRTIVDRRIAEELGLPIAGDDVQVSGVGGNTLAQPVRVARWRLAGIELPASTLDALDLSDGDRLAGLYGLLGSDTLCKFEVIHLDYKNQRLIFHAGPSGQLAARP